VATDHSHWAIGAPDVGHVLPLLGRSAWEQLGKLMRVHQPGSSSVVVRRQTCECSAIRKQHDTRSASSRELLLLLHVLMLLLPLSLQGGFRYRPRTVALDLSGALGGMNTQSFAVLKHAVLRLSKGSIQARQHDSSSVIMQLLLQDSQPHHNKQCYLWCMQPHNILSSCAGVQGSASHKMQQM